MDLKCLWWTPLDILFSASSWNTVCEGMWLTACRKHSKSASLDMYIPRDIYSYTTVIHVFLEERALYMLTTWWVGFPSLDCETTHIITQHAQYMMWMIHSGHGSNIYMQIVNGWCEKQMIHCGTICEGGPWLWPQPGPECSTVCCYI